MGQIHNLDKIFHRSRERIRDLGEVFTPEDYVDSMLDTLSRGKRNFWSDEENIFFEPTCGHGNIVIPIIQKRLNAIFIKAKSRKIRKPEFYAVANTINSLWAIDVDIKNVEHCRERVFNILVSFLLESTRVEIDSLIDENFEFFSHLLSSINWHIHENEALTALSKTEEQAEIESNKTKISRSWFSRNGHHPLNFELTWVEYFRDCDSKDLEPMDYYRAFNFLDNYLAGSSKGQNHFLFTKALLKPIRKIRRSNNEVAI